MPRRSACDADAAATGSERQGATRTVHGAYGSSAPYSKKRRGHRGRAGRGLNVTQKEGVWCTLTLRPGGAGKIGPPLHCTFRRRTISERPRLRSAAAHGSRSGTGARCSPRCSPPSMGSEGMAPLSRLLPLQAGTRREGEQGSGSLAAALPACLDSSPAACPSPAPGAAPPQPGRGPTHLPRSSSRSSRPLPLSGVPPLPNMPCGRPGGRRADWQGSMTAIVQHMQQHAVAAAAAARSQLDAGCLPSPP